MKIHDFQGKVLKDIADSALFSLGLSIVEGDSYHVMKLFKQPCGQTHMGRN